MVELIQAAQGEPFIPSLTHIDIAFNSRIVTLKPLSKIHNLISLSLIQCQGLDSLKGIESSGHSLETLCMVGCTLKSMAFCSKLVNLREVNLGQNNLKKIEGLENCALLSKLHLYHNYIDQESICNLSTNLNL